MKNILFGASGSLGSSIIKQISKKYKKKGFLFVSRRRPICAKKLWIKFDLKKDIKKFKYKKINHCIFLASPKYIDKHMTKKEFFNEYLWLKKIVKDIQIENLIYISSPSIYLKNHYVGTNKKKIENFLLMNKKKFNSLQIWRPFNLINTNYKEYSDHFHNLLFKIMFVQKKQKFTFRGNKNDKRGFADIDEFSYLLLKKAFLKKSFVKNYGNLDAIKVKDIIKIYNKFYYKKFKKTFIPTYFSNKINVNVIKKSKNSIYSKQKSRKVIKKYLINRLYAKNKELRNL